MDNAEVKAAQQWFDDKVRPLLPPLRNECKAGNAAFLVLVAAAKSPKDDNTPVWLVGNTDNSATAPALMTNAARIAMLMAKAGADVPAGDVMGAVIEPIVHLLAEAVARYGCSMVVGIAPPSPTSVGVNGIGMVNTSLMIAGAPDSCGAMPLAFQNALRILHGNDELITDEQAMADAANEPRPRTH